MNILLIDPKQTMKPWKRGKFFEKDYLGLFPLGLMYIQGFLKENGYPETVIRQYWSGEAERINSDINKYLPDIIGISCNSGNRSYVQQLACLIKKANSQIKIVIGGIHASLRGESLLRNIPHYDYIVYGEGEYTFKDLLDNLIMGESLKSVLGISFRLGNDIYTTPKRERIQDLDALPFPCYDSLDPEIRRKAHRFVLVASRGCVYKCSYCSSSVFYGHEWIHRSPENIVKELRFLKRNFFVKHITFNDDFVTADHNYANKLFRLIAEGEFGIVFTVQTRLDSVDTELLQIMKEAGVKSLLFGVESGSEKILKIANRVVSSYTLNKEREVFKEAMEMGFECQMNIIFGWPQETIGDFWQSIKLIRECKPRRICFNPLILYPGTGLYQLAEEQGIIDESFWLTNKRPPKYIELQKGKKTKVLTFFYEIFLFLFYLRHVDSLSGLLATIRLKIRSFLFE